MTNKSDTPNPRPEKGSRTKRIALFFFNPRVWFSWDRMKSMNEFLLIFIERFFVLHPRDRKKSESFEHAVAKFDLDAKSLQAKSLGLKRLSYVLACMAVFLFLYSLYQLYFGSLRGALIALVEVGIALVLAFRYHFWHFQIEHRKLGCSIKDWFKGTFTGEHK